MRSAIVGIRNTATWVLVALLFAAPGAAAKHQGHPTSSATHGGPMENFAVIWDQKLTRSGMPHSPSGWQWLYDQGVRSVVTFRPEHDVDYARYGFKNVMRIPLTGRIMPTERQAEDFLDFVQDPANQPVHIHCQAGKDRTGMMAALVRYAVDGWSLDRALEEARQYRGGGALDGRRTAWLRDWASRHPAGSARLAPSVSG